MTLAQLMEPLPLVWDDQVAALMLRAARQGERRRQMLAPEGRVIMVSGANRGIGRAIAEALYRAGYTLSLGARDPASLDPVAGSWVADRVLAARYDAEDHATHRRWVEATAARFGRIDGLINNAGTVVRVRIEDERDAELDRMWAVNVKAPLSIIRRALPHLRRSGAGRIVNVVSARRVKAAPLSTTSVRPPRH
jgi:NAD(P)-dependent dehydrogenase (short-subunit alcohol dehydrogenase family)